MTEKVRTMEDVQVHYFEASLAMADRVVLNRTNTKHLAANTQKKWRAQRTGIQYNGQGARVLSMKDIETEDN